MGRLFGTDGARGIANTELTCELAMQIGRAAALVLTKQQAENFNRKRYADFLFHAGSRFGCGTLFGRR